MSVFICLFFFFFQLKNLNSNILNKDIGFILTQGSVTFWGLSSTNWFLRNFNSWADSVSFGTARYPKIGQFYKVSDKMILKHFYKSSRTMFFIYSRFSLIYFRVSHISWKSLSSSVSSSWTVRVIKNSNSTKKYFDCLKTGFSRKKNIPAFKT